VPSNTREVPRSVARRRHHAPRHFDGNLKRKIDALIPAFLVKGVPALPVFWRPGGISVRRLQGRDGLDPACYGSGIAAQQVLLHACFQQGLPRSPRGLALLLLPPVQLGQGVVHGLRASIEIAACSATFIGRSAVNRPILADRLRVVLDGVDLFLFTRDRPLSAAQNKVANELITFSLRRSERVAAEGREKTRSRSPDRAKSAPA
jgi:hypothetical protein